MGRYDSHVTAGGCKEKPRRATQTSANDYVGPFDLMKSPSRISAARPIIR